MARGYVKVNADGSFSAVRAIQGTTTELNGDSSFWGERLRCAVAGASPGFYRVSMTADGRFADVTLGKPVKDALREAARLRANAEKQTTRARTGMPGVVGYMEAEHAASARLVNLKRESVLLARWLEVWGAVQGDTAQQIDEAVEHLKDALEEFNTAEEDGASALPALWARLVTPHMDTLKALLPALRVLDAEEADVLGEWMDELTFDGESLTREEV